MHCIWIIIIIDPTLKHIGMLILPIYFENAISIVKVYCRQHFFYEWMLCYLSIQDIFVFIARTQFHFCHNIFSDNKWILDDRKASWLVWILFGSSYYKNNNFCFFNHIEMCVVEEIYVLGYIEKKGDFLTGSLCEFINW